MAENIEDLLPFYALGALTEAERQQVESYLVSHPEAQARLEEMKQTAAALPYDAAPGQPSSDVKRRLMDRVNADARQRFPAPQARPSALSRLISLFLPRAGNWIPHAVAVLSLIFAFVVGAWALSLRDQYASLQAEVASLRQELQIQREVIANIASPNSRAFEINGTEHQPQAHGQLIADAQSGSAVLLVSGLQPLEPGRTYQFWLIRGEVPVAAGLFKVDETGQAVLQVPESVTPGSYNAMGVSIEPEIGSIQPTGDIVMLGEVN
jgi:anti-sigma-K factor RskA